MSKWLKNNITSQWTWLYMWNYFYKNVSRCMYIILTLILLSAFLQNYIFFAVISLASNNSTTNWTHIINVHTQRQSLSMTLQYQGWHVMKSHIYTYHNTSQLLYTVHTNTPLHIAPLGISYMAVDDQKQRDKQKEIVTPLRSMKCVE